jgi:hypothetical protein
MLWCMTNLLSSSGWGVIVFAVALGVATVVSEAILSMVDGCSVVRPALDGSDTWYR